MNNHNTGILNDIVGETLASGAVLDCMGAEGVMFIAVFDTPAAGNKLALEVGNESDGSDHAAVNDSKDRDTVAEVTTVNSEPVGILQLHKPSNRYCNVVLTGAATMVAIKYGHRSQPTVQDVTKAIAAGFVSPYPMS